MIHLGILARDFCEPFCYLFYSSPIQLQVIVCGRYCKMVDFLLSMNLYGPIQLSITINIMKLLFAQGYVRR